MVTLTSQPMMPISKEHFKVINYEEFKFVFILLLSLCCIPSNLYASPTKVFLSGEGINAYELFSSYEVQVLAKRGRGYNLGDLQIVIHDGKRFKEFSIKWYDYVLDCIVPYHSVFCSGGNIFLKLSKPGFLGAWQRMIWFSKLHKYTAWSSSEIVQLAKEMGWEIYEITPEEKSVREFVKRNYSLKTILDQRKMNLWEKALRLVIILIIVAGLMVYKKHLPPVIRYLLIMIVVIIFLSIMLEPV